jgi:hypothetical protein
MAIAKLPAGRDYEMRKKEILSADMSTLDRLYKFSADENKTAGINAINAMNNLTTADLVSPVQSAMKSTMGVTPQDFTPSAISAWTPQLLTEAVGLDADAAAFYTSPAMKDVIGTAPTNPTMGVSEIQYNVIEAAVANGRDPKKAAYEASTIFSKLAEARGGNRNPAAYAKLKQLGADMSPVLMMPSPKLGASFLDGTSIQGDASQAQNIATPDGAYNNWVRMRAAKEQQKARKNIPGPTTENLSFPAM